MKLSVGFAALLVFRFILVSSHQNCSVTRQPDDSFSYQFSEPHAAACDISWEDANKTVIARNSRRNETLVQALTNRSIITKICFDYLLQGKECSGVLVKIACSVNCTSLLERSTKTTTELIPQPRLNCPSNSTSLHQVNPTLSCRTDDWVFGLYAIIIIIAVTVIVTVIVTAIVTVIVVQCFYKRRRWRSNRETVLYSAPLQLKNMNGNPSKV
ncbi:uncharacterized protein [Paralichthys olivaceus]|uniref:uncharacterized protein isoform X2 n=1 Tax=Paralichthys olivaceus TaxID=8255 RepID=UPI0037523C0B